MDKIYGVFLWLLVLLCGGCAVIEVLTANGNFSGLVMIVTGLLLIVYIIRLPVEIKND